MQGSLIQQDLWSNTKVRCVKASKPYKKSNYFKALTSYILLEYLNFSKQQICYVGELTASPWSIPEYSA